MKNLFLLITGLLLFLFSCKKANSDECIDYRQATITKVTMPDSALLNQHVKVNVSLLIESGCGAFFKFEKSNVINVTNVQAIVRYEGCQCTQIASSIDTNFEFLPTARGLYIFQFLQDNNPLIKDTVVIF